MSAASPTILITTPHSYCPETTRRVCDRNARAASVDLADALRRWANVVVLPSPAVLRSTLDMNRPEARQHAYRRDIRHRLARRPSLLIDVHSFPRGAFGDDLEVVLLDNAPGTDYAERLFRALRQQHQSYGVAMALGDARLNDVVGDARLNDVVGDARRAGVPSLLIEYGEHLDERDLARWNDVIARWAMDEL